MRRQFLHKSYACGTVMPVEKGVLGAQSCSETMLSISRLTTAVDKIAIPFIHTSMAKGACVLRLISNPDTRTVLQYTRNTNTADSLIERHRGGLKYTSFGGSGGQLYK